MEKRLNKYIAECGICSRRKADEYIQQGRVKVNNQVVTELGYKVKEKDIVKVDGKIASIQQIKKYFMINKPIGYVSTVKEQFNRPCVTDLVNENIRVYPVGRLDMYSEGLLLLTNDGEFVNKIIHPRQHMSKTYFVKLTDSIADKDIDKLKNGIDIGDYVTKKANVKRVGDSEIEITIYEGKNRQIRKMCEVLGYKIAKLKRVAIGNLKLGNLKTGKYTELSEKEINLIFNTKQEPS